MAYRIHNHFTRFSCLISIFGLVWLSCSRNDVPAIDYPLEVPEGFQIKRAVSPDMIAFPMFASFDDQGRLFVFEATEVNNMGTETMAAEPSYQVRRLEDSDSNGEFDSSIVYADKLPFPMGGCYVDGSLYVAASPDLLKLTDVDEDGVADQRDVILTGWTLNQNGAILSGPFLGPDGWLYLADARRGFDITSQEGIQLKGKGARIWRCLPDGSRLEWLSGGGFDNAIEIVFMPSGDALGTMTYFTDPKDGQRDALMHWVKGGVYPKYHQVIEADKLPLTGDLMPVMTKMPRIAPSGLMRYSGRTWGREYSGNLFSAEFNTGRIMRYQVFSDGSTYRTEDQAFITSNERDIHLTDVLEDADGSLLVVATGGWFIEGCPLSQVAKPEVAGGIYRIEKKSKSSLDLRDAWGKDIALSTLDLERLSVLLTDPWPRVAENALNALVKKGQVALPFLESALSNKNPEFRASLVFAIHRIGGPTAMHSVRKCLSDPNEVVRQAAARSLGLSRDTLSIPSLQKMLLGNSLAVKRQAASALGEIGHASAVPALIDALDSDLDRFAEHAVIFSLIQIGDVQRLSMALKEGTSKIRSGVLIALDQVDDKSLTVNEIIHSLSSADSSERKTAIWIASRHSEWSNQLYSFLDTKLNESTKIGVKLREVAPILMALNSDKNIQRLIAEWLIADTSYANKVFLLDIMSRSEMIPFPDIWKDQLGILLSDQNLEIRMKAMQLIASNQLPGFNDELKEIMLDSAHPDELRLQALRAITWTNNNPAGATWQYLMSLLHSKDPILRREAISSITKFDLNDDQLLEIAATHLPQIELLHVPTLLEIFTGCQSEKVGMAIINTMEGTEVIRDNLSIDKMQRIFESYPLSVRQQAEPLLKSLEIKSDQRREKLKNIEVNLRKGDVGKGRKIFFSKGLCGTCHAVGSEGSDFGPDLSNIGEIRSRLDLLEAIIYPSASFAREYETYRVNTGGRSTLGLIASQSGNSVRIKTGPNSELRFPKSAETTVTLHPESMMPSGLEQQLSEAELSDLLAFLEALPYHIERLIEMQGIK